MSKKRSLLLLLSFIITYSYSAINDTSFSANFEGVILKKEYHYNNSLYSNYINEITTINNSLKSYNKNNFNKYANSYKTLGIIYYNLNLKDISYSYFLKSLDNNIKLNDSKEISTVQCYLGKISYELKNYNKSIEHFKLGIDNNIENLNCHIYITDVYSIIGNQNLSLDYFDNALKISKKLNDTNFISTLLTKRGDTYLKNNDTTNFLKDYKLALLYTLPNKPLSYSDLNLKLSNIYKFQNKESESLAYIKNNIELTNLIKDDNIRSEILYNLGIIYQEQDSPAISLKYYFEAVKISKKTNNYLILSNSYKAISNSYYNLLDYKNAHRYSQLHSAYLDSLNIVNNFNYTELLKIKLNAKYIYEHNNLPNTKTVTIEKTNLNKFLIIFSAIILFLSFIIFNRYKLKNKSEAKLKIQSEELKKLSIVASETDNIVIIMDKNGTFQWFNEGFSRITGYNFNEYTTKYGANLKFASFSSDIKNIINNCINNKRSIHYSTKLITKDKKDIWLQTTLTPVLDEKGSITNLIAIASDITSVKIAEEEINNKNKELESAYRKLLKSESNLKSQSDELAKLSLVARETDNAVMIMDANFNFQWVNEGFIRVYGYTFKQYIDKHGTNLSQTSSNENIDEIIQECIDTRKPVIYTTLCTMNHGKKIWLQTSLTPILDEENNITRIVAIESDIHKIKLAEEEINKKNKELEEANRKLKESEANLREINRTKDKFFSIIAHDLRSPFTSFITVSELISENFNELSKDKILYFVRSINKSAINIHSLLGNLLEWSRSQANRLENNPKNIDLHKITNNALTIYKVNTENKNINLHSKIKPRTFAYADINLVTTIIRNLLNNAIKFTNRGGEICISSKDIDKFVEISIEDTGIGISKDDIDKLFKIDIDNRTIGMSEEKGTGLGLILCKEFVEKSGGKIWVESRHGIGSTFKFTLIKSKTN